MAEFSLDLNEDQLQIQKWVHDFAENVIRPAGPRVGRARRDALADHRGGRPDRSLLVRLHQPGLLRPERACSCPSPTRRWPGATPGSPSSIFGSTLGLAGIAANGTPEQLARVGPPVLRNAGQDPDGGLRRVRGGRGLRRLVAAHPRGLRRGEGRVGHQRHEDLDHQRRHGRPPRGRGLGRPAPSGRGARPASSSRQGPQGCRRARSSRRWGSAPRTPPR